jgi:RNA polymerase sigma-70 factor (ECF subfamily)
LRYIVVPRKDMEQKPKDEHPRLQPTDAESAIRKAWDAGDLPAAAKEMIAQLGPEILRYLAGILIDADVADDAFSLFCERVWSSLPRFEWRCSARTWAYVIARRSAVDVMRAERGRQRRQQPLSDAPVAAIAQHVRTTTRPLLKTEARNALARLRDELPPDDRTLLVLRVDRDLPWEDLARIFLDKESPADSELRRESARLRKRFQLVKERLRERARAAGLLGNDER